MVKRTTLPQILMRQSKQVATKGLQGLSKSRPIGAAAAGASVTGAGLAAGLGTATAVQNAYTDDIAKQPLPSRSAAPAGAAAALGLTQPKTPPTPSTATLAAKHVADKPGVLAEAGSAALGHLQNNWPLYAAGGLGALGVSQLISNLRKRRERKDLLWKGAVDQTFATRHPFVTGFMARCAAEGLKDREIRTKIAHAIYTVPSLREDFVAVLGEPFVEKIAVPQSFGGGLLHGAKNIGNGIWGAAKGLGATAGVGLGAAAYPFAAGLDATGLTESAGAGVGGFTGSMAQNAKSSLGDVVRPFMPNAAMGESYDSQTTGMQQQTLRDAGHSGAASLVGGANAAGNVATNLLVGRVPMLPGGAATQAANVASKVPGATKLMQGAQTAGRWGNAIGFGAPGAAAQALIKNPNVTAGGVAKTLGAGAAVAGRETLQSDVPTIGANMWDGRPAMEGTAISQMLGGNSDPTQKPVGALDDTLASATPETADANAAPPPDAGAPTAPPAAGAPPVAGEPPAATPPPEAAQPPATPQDDFAAVQARLGALSERHNAMAADPQMPAEQKQQVVADDIRTVVSESGLDEQQVGDLLTKGPSPEQAQTGQQHLASEFAKQDPAAPQTQGFMEQVTGAWNGMDTGSQALLVMGLGLGTIGLINSLTDSESGIGSWLMTLLGLGGAAGLGANAGMMGPEAQKLVGGFGQQIAQMLRPAAPQTPEQQITETAGNPNIPKGPQSPDQLSPLLKPFVAKGHRQFQAGLSEKPWYSRLGYHMGFGGDQARQEVGQAIDKQLQGTMQLDPKQRELLIDSILKG